MSSIRQHIRITGVVQGVGFRPFVWKAAQQFQCTGWVRNSGSGIDIQVQGTSAAIASFVALILQSPPPSARISTLTQQVVVPLPDESSFRIMESDGSETPSASVSPDLATCDDCLRELRDPHDRRWGYPFINCTHCGPRFTIQQSVPYDRASTTMRGFEMCGLCRAEYYAPEDRRFHAQPNACPQCGPTIWLVDRQQQSDGCIVANLAKRPEVDQTTSTWSIIEAVRECIATGLIVAIKGLGGFHLACDARQPEAVRRLRQRKQRPFKPLAVMVADLETADSIGQMSQAERQLLASPQRPIMLLRKSDGSDLSDEVAPRSPDIGVMLPYSPLHHLLVHSGDVWVMTSGNLADEPIAYDNAEALERLSSLADRFLLHDRPIHSVCDDSVVRWSSVGAIPLRRSRGWAPLPIENQPDGSSVLAIGAELKSAMCMMVGQQAIVGQHIGDMGNLQTWQAALRSRQHLQSLYQAQPECIVADQHPGYLSSQYARQLATDLGVPLVEVQHHHAHAVALLAEHGWSEDQSCLVCVMDGTGYGTDGAIWGGEILHASSTSFKRVAHLEYTPLPGGDQCILHPARTALAYLYSANMPWLDEMPSVQALRSAERKLLRTQLDRQIQTVNTSSLGRLFDAVSSLMGLCHTIDYEGQAAMELEFLARRVDGSEDLHACYPRVWTNAQPSCLRLAPILQAVWTEMAAAVPAPLIAYRFHQTLALAMVEQCQSLRDSADAAPIHCVGLTGGVFQNALLLELTHAALSKVGFDVLVHQLVPPNDGGLALGQARIARAFQRIGKTHPEF